MGFQSSFNQLLGTIAGGALGAKHLKGQKESLAEQKMQGQFNVEREINREQEQNEVADYNLQNGTDYIDKNEMMADRAGQSLASETNSKGNTSQATRKSNRENWIRYYMSWYGVNYSEANKAYKGESNIVGDPITPEKRSEISYRSLYSGGDK